MKTKRTGKREAVTAEQYAGRPRIEKIPCLFRLGNCEKLRKQCAHKVFTADAVVETKIDTLSI